MDLRIAPAPRSTRDERAFHPQVVLMELGYRDEDQAGPWTHPPALANGSPAPYGSFTRHRLINALLDQVAAHHPRTVRLLDVDSVVAPGNHYRSTVNGKLCRFDGIHFTIYCGQLLQPLLLGGARSVIGL